MPFHAIYFHNLMLPTDERKTTSTACAIAKPHLYKESNALSMLKQLS